MIEDNNLIEQKAGMRDENPSDSDKDYINLLWSDECEYVYGCCSEMSKEEFIQEVQREAYDYGIKLPKEIKVKRETMIYAEKNISADVLMPLSGLGVVIEDYWVLELV